MSPPIGEAVHLTKTFPDATGREIVAVADFSLRIGEGEWVALLGQAVSRRASGGGHGVPNLRVVSLADR
jgi:ABC-type glutathione transport system ATPase component